MRPAIARHATPVYPSYMFNQGRNPFAALRSLFGDRRQGPRRRPDPGAGLLVGVRAFGAGESELLFAHIRDISERGLSAALNGGEREVAALREARALSLILRLPADTLAPRGSLVYARPLGEGRELHLIGARFTDISAADLERLRAYLATLTGEKM